MQALQFDASIPRYALTKGLGALLPRIWWSRIACLQRREVAPPRLPGPHWVRVRVRYGGICGSDLHLIRLHDSPSSSAFTSFPFTMGHENVGRIEEVGPAVADLAPGERVVVDPVLGCRPRGIDPLCPACEAGEPQRCLRTTQGMISAGLLIGACRDTGGSWSPSFVAHRSQVFPLPSQIGDEEGLLIEPFACALHAVLRHFPRPDETVLVLGAGTIGLCVVAALRALESRASLIVLARRSHQAAMAKQLGADHVVMAARRRDWLDELAGLLRAQLLRPILGKRVVVGGADLIFECVGSGESLDDTLRLARSGGRVVLAGLVSTPRGVDWTPVWLKELDIRGTYAYGNDVLRGQRMRTFEAALALLQEHRVSLAPLLTHRFALADYRRALATCLSKARHPVIKAAFEF